MSKTHFTFTGRYAGTPYCGTQKNETDKYMHIKSENSPIMQELLSTDSELCPNCRVEYFDIEEEESY